MKEERPAKFEFALNNLARAAFDAGLTFKEFSEALEILDKAAKRGSETGDSLRVQLLNETGPDKE